MPFTSTSKTSKSYDENNLVDPVAKLLFAPSPATKKAPSKSFFARISQWFKDRWSRFTNIVKKLFGLKAKNTSGEEPLKTTPASIPPQTVEVSAPSSAPTSTAGPGRTASALVSTLLSGEGVALFPVKNKPSRVSEC